MTADQRLLVVGLYLSSALYLIGVFVAGLVTRNELAWKLALLTAGLCYFSYLVQLFPVPRSMAAAFVIASIAAGVAAGFWLLF